MADATDPLATETAEVPVTPAPAAPPAPRSGAVVPMVIGGVLAAGIGFAAALALPGYWPGTDATPLQGQLDAQAGEIRALQATVAQLAETPTQAVDTALADRLAAVEAAIAAPATQPDTALLVTRLDALDQTVAALRSDTSTVGAIDPASLTALQAQIDALKSGGIADTVLAEASAAIDAKLAEAEARVAAVKSAAEAIASATTRRAALHQLQAALDSGDSYGSAMADLTDATLPAVLADHAASGLPTLQSLRQSFPDAARAALDAALRANTGASWTDRVSAFLRGQTGARSLIPREGSDPDAVLSRAEAALAAGDLTAALAEIGALPSAGQSAMADWLGLAKLRQDAALAVQSLITSSGL